MPDRYDPNPKIFREPIRRPASPCTFLTDDQPVYPAGTAIARYHTPSSKAGTYRNEEAAAPTFRTASSATPSTTRFAHAHAHTYSPPGGRGTRPPLAERLRANNDSRARPDPVPPKLLRHARPVRPGRNPPADRVDSAPTRKIARFVGPAARLPARPGSPTAGSRWLPTTCVWPHGSTGRFSGSWTHPLTGAFSPEPASNALPPRIAALCARPRSSNWSAPEAGC